MALTYNKATRDLSIKGTITFNDGTQLHITDSDILNYSFDPQIGSEGLPLGATEAASYRLELSNIGKVYTPEKFDNAEVHMFVGIKEGGEYVYDDFGVWYVDECSAPEQSVSLNLSGYDALATRFNAFYEDDKGVYPTTIGSIAQTACLAAGIELKSISFPNAAVQVTKMPKWADETTLRDILSYCAICAGGFARIARNGQLEIVSFADGQTYTLDSGIYQTFTQTGGSAFAFNCIEAILKEDDEEYTRFAIDDSIKSNATNTIQIDYNPLLTSSILNSVVSELRGITMEPGEVAWGGDPSVMCGDYYNVETLNGRTVKIMVTAQSYSFDGGLSVTESCNLPTLNTQTSATYSTSTNMYDAKGNIKATRISGLDKSIVNATVGHFENLTAETAEIDNLLAAYIEALNLVVGKLDAKILAAHSITADQIAAGAITAEKLAANIIDAEQIKTESLEALTAKIESLKASDIETDRLAAALATFTVVTAGTADFDRASVEHLVANLFNLTGSGVMEDVFIHNLKIAYAQMVSASIGNLVLQASNGEYYQIDVDQDGNVSATQVRPSAEEIEEGVFRETRPILATSMTVDDMNASSIKAVHMLINRIDAARINVDELWAREAFIDLLRTSNIVGGKSITIIAEDAQKAADLAKNAAKTFRQETAPGFTDGVKTGDLWVKPSTGQIRQADTINFAVDSEGVMYLEHASGDGLSARISEDDIFSMEINFDMMIAEDGSVTASPSTWSLVQDKSIVSMVENLTDTVDGKTTVFYQDEDPTTTGADVQPGDLWYDTNAVPVVINRYTNGAWVEITDDALSKALKAAGTAQATADGKIVSYAQADPPENASIGDIWIETDNQNKLYRYNGSEWVPYRDGAIDAVITEVNNANNVAAQAVEDISKLQNRVVITDEGLFLRDENEASVLKVNSASVNIGTNVGSAAGYSQFTANYVQFGNYQLRKTTDGGLVFKMGS